MSIIIEALEAFTFKVTLPILYDDPRGLDQLGTGTLFEINSRIFLVTARHIFDFDSCDLTKFALPRGFASSTINTLGALGIHRAVQQDVDIAILELYNDEMINFLKSGWKMLSLENIATASSNGKFILCGYPSEKIKPDGENLKGAPFFVYTERLQDTPERTKGPVVEDLDLFFNYQKETSAALGFGFRCGFLGLLHLEVIRDRIEREYDIDLITTAPSVIYHVHMRDGTVMNLHNPADMPDPTLVDHIEEPRIKATILVPDEFLGDVLKLCQDRRGIQIDLTYAGARAMVVYDLPLNEVVFDFYDRLKSVTKGYASFDYQMHGYTHDELVKMSILVNDEPVDALSTMVHRARAEARGRAMCAKLKELIPQHMFKVPIQAAIGGRIIARETISALRKDVTAKCYGGGCFNSCARWDGLPRAWGYRVGNWVQRT